MEHDLRKSLTAICRSLQHWNVRYLFVGGTAVALHGYYRHSMGPNGKLTTKPDIDVWYDPTYENYFSLLQMLKDLDLDVAKFMNWSLLPMLPRLSIMRWAFTTWNRTTAKAGRLIFWPKANRWLSCFDELPPILLT